MIVYNRIDKVIIIPECGCPSSGVVPHSRCEREVQIAYTSGWSGGYEQGLEDCSGSTCNLTTGTLDLNNGDSGRWIVYPNEGYDGFDQFRVYDQGYGEGKYQSGWTAGFNSGSARSVRFELYVQQAAYYFRALWPTGHSVTINGNEAPITYISYAQPFSFDKYAIEVQTTESAITTMEVTLNFQNNGDFPYITEYFQEVKVNECYDLNILSQNRELVQEYGIDIIYKYTLTFDTTPIYDKLSYQAGLAACQQQIHNVIYVQNEAAGHNIGGFVTGSQRDLMINGSACPYSYTIDGDGVFGFDAQFNLEAAVQLAVPQSFAFTVDCKERWESQNGPDITSVGVFGNAISNYTVVKTPTTAINPNSFGITYTITITGNQ